MCIHDYLKTTLYTRALEIHPYVPLRGIQAASGEAHGGYLRMLGTDDGETWRQRGIISPEKVLLPRVREST